MPKLTLKKSGRVLLLKKKEAEKAPEIKLKRGPYAPNPRITA